MGRKERMGIGEKEEMKIELKEGMRISQMEGGESQFSIRGGGEFQFCI